MKDKREKKVDSKSNNKSLIGAATMLSVVSMLNYAGGEPGVPSQVCTSLDERYSEDGMFRVLQEAQQLYSGPPETFGFAGVAEQ